MFLGNFEPRLDDKGRVILPAKFREDLADGLVITRGQEYCLYVFTKAEFQKLYEELIKAPITSKQSRDYIRVLLASASDELFDKQGRITIPQPLRAYAQLEKEVVVNGAGNRIEIWDQTRWNEYLSGAEESFAGIADEIFPL
ncbi:division/cell wall cluster transcriptional repressor MraZ [Gleimia sp. 6138-11-ORH1]|uniref:division/cell wall cluster transcriptional repressor MraZ n=1 Tax=Gleimia sp. 6138-11-ORH1 TaxID=2973937 RepID=UPI00216907CB|nr:division/cell wall cluster transcriptional repressor MraZ [Gleimia sp. 6138-11-ORH1]MCS4484547.1 division/cell wall cluster transcriptional repressor MraZ [Gleimia sp. 6138-11-ORH1]